MKAVTCPQCGGLIKNIRPHQPIVQCDYCGAKVLTDEKIAAPETAVYTPGKSGSSNPNDWLDNFFRSKTGVFLTIVGALLIFAGVFVSLFKPNSNALVSPATVTGADVSVGIPIPMPTAKNVEDPALVFGGKGTSAGLFDGAGRIAVGSGGDIYAADDTLRVQRFDRDGKFLNLWNVKGTKNERIDRLAAAPDGSIYVLIGGDIVVFNGETGEQRFVMTDSRRHYITDFVLRDDGGMMYIAEGERGEEFVQTRGKVVVNHFNSIHTRAADARIPTGGIKIAVDGKGDIFSVYALGGLFGTFNYNEEDLMTFHFAPDGKFLDKFAAGLMPKAILTDNQSRVYILTTDEVVVFSNSGTELKRIPVEGSPNHFAIDKQNNLYTVADETVRKLKSIDFSD